MTHARRQVLRRVVGIVAVCAVLSPLVTGRDSFPLSTYPMYASVRPEVASFAVASGVTASGERRRLSLQVIARTDDPLIAQSTLTRAVSAGQAGELCALIARRAPGTVVRIEIATERHRIVDAAAGRSSLVARTPHAACEVGALP